jgi:hypothetical protein
VYCIQKLLAVFKENVQNIINFVYCYRTSNQFMSASLSGVRRQAGGLPASWLEVEPWLDLSKPVIIPPPPDKHAWRRKCPDVQFLTAYDCVPHADFWQTFPFTALPAVPLTSLRLAVLESLLSDLDPFLNNAQRFRGQRVLDELAHGVRVPFKQLLPSLHLSNSESTRVHGEEFTDTLA